MTNNLPEITSSSAQNAPDSLDIIFKLKRLGFTQSRLAVDLSVTPSIVNNVIHDRATCFPVANHIAQLLETRVQDLWPNRYVFKPRHSRVKPANGKQPIDNSGTNNERGRNLT